MTDSSPNGHEVSSFPFVHDPLLTVEEAAEYMSVGITTINKWRREKRVPCVRVIGDVRFRRSDLNTFAESHRQWGWR